jgi:hypothetical protein
MQVKNVRITVKRLYFKQTSDNYFFFNKSKLLLEELNIDINTSDKCLNGCQKTKYINQ